MGEKSFQHGPRLCLLATGLLGLALAACSTQPERPDERSSPFPDDPAACDALREQGYFADFIDEGNTLAIRCFLAIRDVEPDSFSLRYLLYRLEGIEPVGLDERVRRMDRLELAARIANIHDLDPSLEPFGWYRGCTTYDEPARALLARTPPQTEVKGCWRWGL